MPVTPNVPVTPRIPDVHGKNREGKNDEYPKCMVRLVAVGHRLLDRLLGHA